MSVERNPLLLARTNVCQELIPNAPVVVLVHTSDEKKLPEAVSYALGFFKVPVISTAARSAEFSNKDLHPTFMRTVPPWFDQAQVWISLLKAFKFENVLLLYSNTPDGAALSSIFGELAETNGIKENGGKSSLHPFRSCVLYGTKNTQEKDPAFCPNRILQARILQNSHKVEASFEMEPSTANCTDKLRQVSQQRSTVMLLDAAPNDALVIFRDAEKLNLTNAQNVWIVSEQVLKTPRLPLGIIGTRLKNLSIGLSDKLMSNNRKLLRFAYHAIKLGLKDLFAWASLHNQTVKPPYACDRNNDEWIESIGPQFRKSLFGVKLQQNGLTIEFNKFGDPEGEPYEIVNVQSDQDNSLVVIGYFDPALPESEEMKLKLVSSSTIVWPGGIFEKPTGYRLKTHLKIFTIRDEPFVYARKVESPAHCGKMPFDKVNCSKEVLDITGKVMENESYCCYGMCIELLDYLSNATNFTYDLILNSDGFYGSWHPGNLFLPKEKEWSGIIGEIARGKADLAVGALSVSSERELVVDFTKPFMYHGISILQKRKPRLSPMESFMQPFKWGLWTCIFSSVVIVALCLFFLDKMSPFSKFFQSEDDHAARNARVSLSDENDDLPLDFSGAMWFSWGVLLDSGIGERTPRSFSARVLGMVWCGFVMIMMASYTANLAAFLVLDRPDEEISGISDSRLRNPSGNFSYATVKDSSVYSYFKRHPELSTMHRTMEGRNYDEAANAVDAVLQGSLDAFIWDSVRLNYEVSKKRCELTVVGETFGESAYALALRKHSMWTDRLTLAILQSHESGHMERLEQDWFERQQGSRGCFHEIEEAGKKAPANLGIDNMRDLFILLGGGVVVGMFAICIEIVYMRTKMKRQRKRNISSYYFNRWKSLTRLKSLPESQTTTALTGPNHHVSDSTLSAHAENPKEATFLSLAPYQIPAQNSNCNTANWNFSLGQRPVASAAYYDPSCGLFYREPERSSLERASERFGPPNPSAISANSDMPIQADTSNGFHDYVPSHRPRTKVIREQQLP